MSIPAIEKHFRLYVQHTVRTIQYLAGEEGFEPSHAGIKIQCLNQLGDSPTRVGSLNATNR